MAILQSRRPFVRNPIQHDIRKETTRTAARSIEDVAAVLAEDASESYILLKGAPRHNWAAVSYSLGAMAVVVAIVQWIGIQGNVSFAYPALAGCALVIAVGR